MLAQVANLAKLDDIVYAQSGTALGNSTAIQEVFKRNLDQVSFLDHQDWPKLIVFS
jgi:hypothetical protein